MATGDVYTIASGKGGVGKTTTSINLGAALAERGLSVIVVELDLAMANIADYLDLYEDLDELLTLHDVLSEERNVFEAVIETESGFDLLPSGLTLKGFADVDITRLQWVLQALRDEYDIILLDTGAGLSEETVFPLKLADGVVLVTTPRLAAVRDTEKTRQLADTAETDIAGVVFTMSSTESAPPMDKLAERLDGEMLGHIFQSDVIPESQEAGKSVLHHAPNSELATELREIARQFVTLHVDDSLVDVDPSRIAGANKQNGTDPEGTKETDEEGGKSLAERAKSFVGFGGN